MSGKEAIIERIIADAQDQANDIVSEAQTAAKDICAAAESKVKANRQKATEKLIEDGEEILRRRMSVANLDAKKSRLFAKQKLLETVFDEAREAVLALDDEKYLLLIEKLIKGFSAEGETVTIAERDKKRITKKFLDGFGKKLTLSDSFGDFDGGIMLSKDGYDKNLTLDVLLDESRERVENKVAETLFGE